VLGETGGGRGTAGTLRCWGDGAGARVPSSIGPVVAVFAGADSPGTCVDDGRAVRCWGTGIAALDVAP
jgi:hypothetical protein